MTADGTSPRARAAFPRRSSSVLSPFLLFLLLLLLSASPSLADFFNFGGQQQAPPRKQRTPFVDYYAALELPPSSDPTQISEKQIKQQFRLLSRKYHPDAASSSAETKERYVAIQQAYEVLSDKSKRRMYDLLGMQGLELLEQRQRQQQQGGNPFGGQNPFGDLFGQAGDPFKAQDRQLSVEVDLVDIFNGAVKPVKYRKNGVCLACKGQGAPLGSRRRRCPHCGGRGVTVGRIQIAPGMFQQVQQVCQHCQGEGEMANEVCPSCHGQRLHQRSATVAVEVPRGAPDGHTITFEMEGEEAPDKIPGDLIVHLTTRPHPVYKRRGADLEATLVITFKEALLGFEKELTNVDGEEKVEVRRIGVPTPYGANIRIAGKGLPRLESSERGDLFITVTFNLPKTLTQEQKEAIQDAF